MHGRGPQPGRGDRRSKKRLKARARWEVTIGWEYIQAIRKSGREPDPEDLPPELDWEEPIWDLYERTQTQWRTGLRGPVGLDYNPAIALIHARGWALERALALYQAIEAGFFEAWQAQTD